MPKRTDLKSILIIGAGPIVIGQACEFDYSGTQACKALKEEGYRIILVNSNPATIMTDPDMADATYIEPVNWQTVASIIEKERPDAILPTMGGQTALNCALDLAREGILDKYQVEMIGATAAAIDKAEDREQFRQAMQKIGLAMPAASLAHSIETALAAQAEIGFPSIIRPSFTMGGSGGGIAYNRDEFISLCERGLTASPTHEIMLERSVLGWKEFEMEVVRDKKDNCIIVCCIENIDPMGVHTGDSITVAPAQTLTDKEYQCMRNAAIAVLREIGVETGGANVQFAVNPVDGELLIIEMNPRVSRSSALASKATGFPIAKVAAKLAIGYTLDELRNDITDGMIPAAFEPTIDYIVTKIPHFAFEKFPDADARLTTQMKAVGEVMAIGRNFQESLQKAIRALEIGKQGLDEQISDGDTEAIEQIKTQLRVPNDKRLWYLADAFRWQLEDAEIFECCQIDPWFLAQIKDLVITEQQLKHTTLADLNAENLRGLKRKGFSDARIASLLTVTEAQVRAQREKFQIYPVYKRIDSCAAEFATSTAFMYSSYEEECEAQPGTQKKIMVLGSGPNRIGQGLEFDYCCVQAALAMREAGYETIMVNCNPETVSTDYDTSDRLYFEPLTLEDVLEIIRVEKPTGVIMQYGGQTPLKLAQALEQAGAPVIGTSPEAIDLAEDRQRFQQLLITLALQQPPNRTATTLAEALEGAAEIGYPLVVRPSYVLGGRAMEIVYHAEDLTHYIQTVVAAPRFPPILLDRFLNNAIEVDVDAVCDGSDVYIAGLMEHIEQAGVHSGDSACSLPPHSLSISTQQRIMTQMCAMAQKLKVIGLVNAQFAIQGEEIFVLEVNPRASRTVPFVSKATGIPVAKIAAHCMVGKSLAEQGLDKNELTTKWRPPYFSVKESVFPFIKFPGVDPLLGPEMKSTGEVMGVGGSFAEAFGKAQIAAGERLPSSGNVFISVKDEDKPAAISIARELIALGFILYASHGTQQALQAATITCHGINKVREGQPHIVDMLKNDEIDLIINTTEGKQSIADSYSIRRTALQHRVFYTTTMAAAAASTEAIQNAGLNTAYKLQDLHKRKLL